MNGLAKSVLRLHAPVFKEFVAVRTAVSSKLIPAKDDESFVDTDADKLSKFVCINFKAKGGAGPEIQPDDKYPTWLFQLRLDNWRPQLEEMSPEQDGWLYWIAWRKRKEEQAKRFEYLRIKHLTLQRSPTLRKFKEFGRYRWNARSHKDVWMTKNGERLY
ncbi:hypothetical protein Ddc_10355 [Ditylenchus destructor]|nr:hypothetical protein Ddc_10355 [Ditylenchus destructor]